MYTVYAQFKCSTCIFHDLSMFWSGEYIIDVYFYGKPIIGSPFRVQVFDWNKIALKNLPSTGMVGRLCEFDSKGI